MFKVELFFSSPDENLILLEFPNINEWQSKMIINSTILVSLSYSPHPIHHEILLPLSSKYILNLTIYHHIHSYYHGTKHQFFLFKYPLYQLSTPSIWMWSLHSIQGHSLICFVTSLFTQNVMTPIFQSVQWPRGTCSV